MGLLSFPHLHHHLEIMKLATLLLTIPKKATRFLRLNAIETMALEETMEVCIAFSTLYEF